MSHNTTIVSTKKLLTAQKQVLLEQQFTVVEDDFIKTSYQSFELSTLHQNLIFTSQNAVQSVLQHPQCESLKSKKVFCVGMKTKALLTDNGFDVIAYTGYAADLGEIIALIYGKESFTFFCGNLRREVLPATLRENHITFNEIEVYQTELSSTKINNKADGILFFSPSAVESYLKMNRIKEETCFCIGETTAEALEQHKIKNIVIAEKPTVEMVIAEVLEYY